MKKKIVFIAAALVLCTMANAGVISGGYLLDDSGFVSNPDSLPVGVADAWRYDAAGTRVQFQTSQANTGTVSDNFNAGTVDLLNDGAVTGDADYDVNTTKLSNITADWNLATFAYAGTASYDPDHVMTGWYTITLVTAGDTFVGTSNIGKIHDGPTRLGVGGDNTLLETNLIAAWNVINWGADPFADGGVVYADIASINVDFYTSTLSDNIGTGIHSEYFSMNGAPIQYEATTVIPEPATLGMVAAMGAGILFVRRRLMI